MIHKSTLENIRRAAQILVKGGVVAFPTETVYGLGANALDAGAVKKIFEAKGRPSDNPLIVHIADMKELKMVAYDIPEVAFKLMKKFWPGPLTFVLKKTRAVPEIVTAGGQTVAVRMPKHPVALALLKAAKCPVAAPSANLAGKPSPTTAAHVSEDFGDTIEMILDGGKTKHGLESTVIDFSGMNDGNHQRVEILRSGAITGDMLSEILGYKPKTATHRAGGKVRSPGLKYKHYAPSVPMILIGATDKKKMVELIQKKLNGFDKKLRIRQKSGEAPERVGILCVKEHAALYSALKYPAVKKIVVCGSLKKPQTFGRELYASLRKFNKKNVDFILAENVGNQGIGQAIWDRLSRAATEII